MNSAADKKEVCVFGSDIFSINVISKLKDCKSLNIAAVITTIDKPRGRGGHIQPNQVKKYCLDTNIKVIESADVNSTEFLNFFKANLSVDYNIIVSFGQILNKDFLSLPVEDAINIHPSLLPKYRGASPIITALANGEEYTGVTLFSPDCGIDTGDLLAQRTCKIEGTDDNLSLTKKLSELAAVLLCDYAEYKCTGRCPEGIFKHPASQEESDATYTGKLNRIQYMIDWNKSAEDIKYKIAALSPNICAFTFSKDKRLKIYSSYIFDEDYNGREANGSIKFLIKKGPIVVKCGRGLLAVTRLQFEGKRVMNSDEVINGRKINVGEVLKNAEN